MFGRLAAILLAVTFSACAGPPAAIIGVEGAPVGTRDVAGVALVDVFVATNRADADDPAIMFSGERSDELSFARMTVSIPPNHASGEIERPRRLPPNPRTDFSIIEPRRLPDRSAWIGEVDGALETLPARDRDVLVFVHGYNTDLTSAVLRTAQFAHDSGFDGLPVVFSWASRGRTLDYVYDLNSALHARENLVEVGAALTSTRAEGVDLLAHSMGNLLTLEALRSAALVGRLERALRLRSVTLAAPDVDLDLFRKQLSTIPRNVAPIYVLVSGDDRALAISRRIAGGVPRAGDADPETLAGLGVEVIDLTAVADRESIHHTKFADAPEVVQLTGRLLNRGNTLTAATPDALDLADLVAGAALVPVQILSGGRAVVLNQ